MKKIITLLLALAIGFGLKAQCPLTQAVDFTATDIHGTEVHLFDILNSGQYVLIDFFFTTCGPCQQATPKVTESYYAMGCNMHDVFYIEIATGDSETNCLNWVNTYGIEYPTISGTAGGTGICSTYQIGAFPSVILIAPNRQIVIQDLWPINNAQSIITALEAQGLQQHDCNGTTYHPLVGISVAQVMETEVTATFTPNEDCVSYAYMLATENEMQEWTSSTGIGLPEYLWNYGIHNSGVFTHWFSNLTPNTEYVIYAVSVDINGSLGEVVQEAVTTLPSSSTHGYVDLGLPSGLLWAICNVGANATEEYGDYFAWGETQPKDDYSWNTYQYSNGIYGNALTKYCTNSSYGYNGFTDNLTILLPEDDAATANWGNDWRMPTKEEWQELCNNTTVIWTIQNGVRGRLFTAANGNSLFLPAAGFRTDDLHYYAGSFGDYWSSSLNTDVPDGAWGLDFGSGNEYNLSGYSRACGFTVRPVRAGVQNYAPTGAINGLFSVGEGQQVYFSQGNLQYHATSNIWRFALNQFDCVGEDNSNISPTYNGWIDLFGWGTGNNPTNSSTNGEEYNTFNEWGNNIITNGDNTTVWRTLTNEEWQYLYFERNTASGIRFVLARVDNRCGLVLLPDSWSSSIYNLNNVNNVWGYNDNIITASVWASVFEPNGAVFLPAAGGREEGTIIEGLDWNGEYWSSTPSYYNPFHTWFHGSNIGTDTGHPSYYGKSVRLVHPVGSAATYTISATANPSNGGTVTGGGTYNQDATCTLTATANIGYSFVNWTENGMVVSDNSVYAFTVTGNRNLIANFEYVSSESYVITATANPAEGGRIVFGTEGQTLLFEPFEEYTVGNKIAAGAIAAGHDWWTTWSNSPGSNEDGTIANYDGTQCGHFTYYSDQVLLLGDEDTGVYDLEFDILVPEGKNGYFSILHHFAGGGSIWAMQCYLHMLNDGQNSTQAPGHGTIHAGSNGTADLPCVYDAWMHFRLHVDADNNVASCYYTAPGEEEMFVCEWQWSLDSFGENVTNRNLAAMDFFPSENAATSEFYLDNINFSRSRSESVPEASGGTLRTSGTYEAGSTCIMTAIANPGYTFTGWTKDGVVVSTTSTYSFTVTENATYIANFSESQGEITQTTDLAQGWNWWSTYVEQDGIDGLAMLEESLGENGYQIKSQTDFVTNYGSMWFGMLSSITNEETYMIDNTTSCQIEMTGAPVTPSDHPITVSSGWNWIGYPCTNTMSVSEAFSGYTPANGDQVKSQSDYAIYYSGMWIGQLQSITPGTGLMYLSNNATSTTLVYPDGGRSTEIPTLPKATHWTNDIHAYPHNMTVMAVVELNDEELNSENYELAAFANGECRGSVKLTYVEPLDRHVAFLTIAGNDAVELAFRLYDAETGVEYYDAEESLSFTVNAIVGEPEDVFVVHFRGTTGMDELSSSVQVYPNPVKGGEQFSIRMKAESKSPIQVELVNAMGVETLRATSAQMPAMLTAPSVAGVYTLRITVEGKGTVVRKLLVK